MSLLNAIGGASGSVVPKLDASEVFSTYTYTGNGSTQTINNGIDLAGKGGMVWIKNRSTTFEHIIANVISGTSKYLCTNDNVQERNSGGVVVTAFNSNGFSIGSYGANNGNGNNISSWTFREAPKFFHQVLKVHTNGTASTVDLSTLGTVGMVTIKSTVNVGNWFTWHKDLTAGNNLKLNLTDAQSATNAYLSVSGTTLTIASTAPSDTYIVYSWAHDTSADGIIQCGSFTADGSGNATVTLGWESQYLMTKGSSTTGNWVTADSMRGFTTDGVIAKLVPNSSVAEATETNVAPTTTGFRAIGYTASQTFIYMAIRRPNKVPTSGTEVFAVQSPNSGTSFPYIISGFPVDLGIVKGNKTAVGSINLASRLQGDKYLLTSATDAEGVGGGTFTFDSNVGWANLSGANLVSWMFKRAKGFFDIACYTGTGVARTVNHNLGVVPELMIVKTRSYATDWAIYHKDIGNTKYSELNKTGGFYIDSTYWNNTTPTTTTFTVGTAVATNYNANTLIAYLFATLAGVSKVGSYTGNGTTQTINCGFSTGARFVLVKRTDNTGDWYVWDTARGIVAANDPHLSLNTTEAEVIADDSVDPESTGFIVNQNATTNINVNLATYIYLAIS